MTTKAQVHLVFIDRLPTTVISSMEKSTTATPPPPPVYSRNVTFSSQISTKITQWEYLLDSKHNNVENSLLFALRVGVATKCRILGVDRSIELPDAGMLTWVYSMWLAEQPDELA